MITAFFVFISFFSTPSEVEKVVVDIPEQQKVKYIKIPTQWTKIAKKPN